MTYDKEDMFLVVTDASNYKDCGAWAAIVTPPGSDARHHMFGGIRHAHDNTYREEFIALLEALYFVHRTQSPEQTALVYWLCDNETLVNQVNGTMNADAAHQDLWARFFYFESGGIAIHGQHIPRETNKDHDRVDLLASSLRIIMDDYAKDCGLI